MNTISLFGLNMMNAPQDRAIAALMRAGRSTVHFINAHCVNQAAENQAYRKALQGADVLLPDGSGIALAARMSGEKLVDNLNGTDLFLPLCAAAAAEGKSIYLLGAAPGVAQAAADRASDMIPGLQIAGTRDGYFGSDQTDEVIDRINASGADILLVAMGVPMQELWVERHRAALAPRLVMGVGAQFDFHSGRVSRAPKFLRRIGAEWVWRLAIEPRRMAKRYLLGNPVFIGRALRQAVARIDAGAIIKRGFDIFVSATALAVLSPLLLATAAAIRLESPGKILFQQTRVGRDGKPFRIFKFRSMYRDAEARRAALLDQSDREGICFKSRNDPRVTRVGHWIRRFSVDELPQILNVLRGEMSVVGPRPALPEEVAAYPERAKGRLAVKPGITGLWQVSGRADIGFDKMIDMDLAYARARSIWLDIAILALTARAVLSGRGAY